MFIERDKKIFFRRFSLLVSRDNEIIERDELNVQDIVEK